MKCACYVINFEANITVIKNEKATLVLATCPPASATTSRLNNYTTDNTVLGVATPVLWVLYVS